jgi:hypothetical protein
LGSDGKKKITIQLTAFAGQAKGTKEDKQRGTKEKRNYLKYNLKDKKR